MADGLGDTYYTALMGEAALHLWAELPQPVQEKLFEHAVVIGHQGARDESLRERLARYLHDRHARTQAAASSALSTDRTGQ
jgi:hypothetical protein